MVKIEQINHYESLADQEAWKGLQQGDLNALGELYDLYVDKLFYIGIKIISDRNIVQDQIHDLFLDFYKSHENLSDVTNVQGYVITCFKRRLYKHNNLKVKHLNVFWDSKANKIANDLKLVSSHEENIINSELQIERNYKLELKLSKLTDHQKSVLEMRFKENRSYEEIAKLLNLSVSSARTLLYRAIKTLRNTPLSLLF